jgi:predicted HAD superfamily Cof-like phosphohydrolase
MGAKMTNRDKVLQFHKAAGLSVDVEFEQDEVILRANLIAEEFGELMVALSTGDPTQIMKEAADLKYVIEGTLVTFGLDPEDKAFDRVHESNMTKIPTDGKIVRREDGKILKPDTYREADLEDLV